MASVDQTVRVYQELAGWHEREGQAQMRDRFLVLAADALLAAGKKEEADRVRQRLLQINPHHLLKSYPSMAEAMKSVDVQNYVEGLRRSYPPDAAAQLLDAARSGKAGQQPPVPPPPAGPAEAQPIYRIQEPKEEPRIGARKTSPDVPHTVPPPGAVRKHEAPSRLAGYTGPAGAAGPSPLWSDAVPPSPGRNGPPDLDPAETPGGAWLATFLFWVLFVAGGALLVHTLGGPVWPQ